MKTRSVSDTPALKLLMAVKGQADNIDLLEPIRLFSETQIQLANPRTISGLAEALSDTSYDLIICDHLLITARTLPLLTKVQQKNPSLVLLTFAHDGDKAKTEDLDTLKCLHTFIVKELDSGGLNNLIHMALKYALKHKAPSIADSNHPIYDKLQRSYSYHASIDENGRIHMDWLSDSFAALTGYSEEEINEKGGWITCVIEDDLPNIKQFTETLINNESSTVLYRAQTKSGDIIWLESLGQPEWNDAEQRVIGISGGAREVSEREYLQGKLELLDRQQAATVLLGEYAATNPELHSLLKQATILVTQTLNAWICEIFLLDESQTEGVLQAAMGLNSKQIGELKLPLNRNNELKYTIENNEATLVQDLRQEKRYRPSAHLRRNKALSGICAPIRAGNSSLGMLAVYSNTENAYTTENLNFIQAIATTIAAFATQYSTEYQLRNTRQALVERTQQISKTLISEISQDEDNDEDDISVIVKTAKELRSRDLILSATSSASSILIDASDWETAMDQVLAKLGKATDASRAYIFNSNIGNEPNISMNFEWVNKGIEPLINGQQFQNVPLNKNNLDKFQQVLTRSGIVVGHIKDLSKGEQQFFKKMKALSTAVVPIFVEEKWWGFLGFDACNKPRSWSTAEVDALRIASNTISTVLARKQNEAALQAILEGTVSKIGEDYFRSLLQHLANIFDADYSLIAETSGPDLFYIKNALHKGELLSPFEYKQKISSFTKDEKEPIIQYSEAGYKKFPENKWLRKHKIQGYLAIPVFSNNKEMLGHIAVMSSKPLQANTREQQILKIFAARVAVELERQRMETENLQLARIVLESPNMVLSADLDGNILFKNKACDQMIEELHISSVESLLPEKHHQFIEQTKTDSQQLVTTERAVGGYHIQWNYYLQNDLNRVHIYSIDMTQYRIVEEQLRKDAFHDPLTGLPNRNYFNSLLEHAIEHTTRRKDYTFAVLFLDLDRFKYINDSLGHAYGDKFLEIVAQLLKKCLRPGDHIARLGGDEFAILLDAINDEQEVTNVANRIQQVLAEPIQLNQHETFTSASIGIALSTRGYTNPQDIVRDADIAMYSAKQAGKARFAVFDSRMHDEMVHVMRLEVDLRHALQNNELSVYFQPIYSITEKRLAGLEALVRWQHPERGFLEPHDFIPMAEEMSIIRDIDYLVLNSAAKYIKGWQKKHKQAKDIKVHINLSGAHFNDTAILAEIGNVLKDNRLPNDCLQLELTEGILMDSTNRSAEIFNVLSQLGVHISIDDFGVGYSSLSRLTKLPIDILKIDRGFVQSMIVDSSSLNITRAVIDLAHDLDMEVIAEGVETQGQYQILSRMGCQYAQGYYISKPLTAEETEQFLLNPPKL